MQDSKLLQLHIICLNEHDPFSLHRLHVIVATTTYTAEGHRGSSLTAVRRKECFLPTMSAADESPVVVLLWILDLTA